MMRKQQKIDVLQKGIEDKSICRCYFSYESHYFYCYPNAVNEKFIMGQEEDDFLLDGYFIRKLSHLTKVETKTDNCNEINRMIGITSQVVHPGVDISSWRSIFEDLSRIDTYVIIEDVPNGQFAIGSIVKVLKDKLYFKHFDAMGEWDPEELEIRYSRVSGVEWGTRYDVYWKKYLEQK